MTLSRPAVTLLALCFAVVAQAQAPAGTDKPAPKPRTARPAPVKPESLPPQDLTPELLYRFLVAELAAQRGDSASAVQIMMDLARATRDPRVAQRATELAWSARLLPEALEAAGLWMQYDPGSAQARQVLAALLVSQSRLSDAQAHFEKWLAADRAATGPAFLQLSALLSRHQDKAAVLELMQSLARGYPEVPEAHYAVAQTALAAGRVDVALEATREALRLRPGWEQAALLRAQALGQRANAEALAFLKDFLVQYPQSPDARLAYARLLVGEKDYTAARAEFQRLASEFPDNPDVAVATALLSLQLKDYDAAETQLKRALENNYKDADTVRFYLGQLAEERKRPEEALQWYSSVARGEQLLPARARYAGVLAKQGRLPEARKYLQEAAEGSPSMRLPLLQAEAQLLRDAGDYRGTYELLGEALAKSPESPDLLYEHAMAAEKLDRLEEMERNLRKLIALRPDHAHAYNALGYSLADRNIRLQESYELIEKGLKLAPNDPFIMDSMGWVLYRMGRHAEALEQLERAYKIRPDAEIAAHLGEVLWVMGRQDEARRLWTDSLKEHPGNEVLQATVKRLAP